MEVGEEGMREIIYLSLHCHHQDDFCIKVGSDESHFNVSLIVRDKVTRQCPQTTTFDEKGEPKRNRTEVLPLGQTGSHPPAASIVAFISTRFLEDSHVLRIERKKKKKKEKKKKANDDRWAQKDFTSVSASFFAEDVLD